MFLPHLRLHIGFSLRMRSVRSERWMQGRVETVTPPGLVGWSIPDEDDVWVGWSAGVLDGEGEGEGRPGSAMAVAEQDGGSNCSYRPRGSSSHSLKCSGCCQSPALETKLANSCKEIRNSFPAFFLHSSAALSITTPVLISRITLVKNIGGQCSFLISPPWFNFTCWLVRRANRGENYFAGVWERLGGLNLNLNWIFAQMNGCWQ